MTCHDVIWRSAVWCDVMWWGAVMWCTVMWCDVIIQLASSLQFLWSTATFSVNKFCSHKNFTYGGFYCPISKTKFCELPVDCSVCGLTLVCIMCWCVDALMCRCVDLLMCWFVDVSMCWCVDDCVDVLVCWCVGVLMCWCVGVLMVVLMCWCVGVLGGCVAVLMC